jgi:hypothetical protein
MDRDTAGGIRESQREAYRALADSNRLRDRVRRQVPVEQPVIVRRDVGPRRLNAGRHGQHTDFKRELLDDRAALIDLGKRDIDGVEPVQWLAR